jgi:hypothetical protein
VPPPTFTQLALIEPAVYWRLFALDYQAEQFEVFHRTLLTRWTHYLGTEAILFCFFLLSWGHGLAPLILGAVLSLWYLRMNVFVGFVATLQLLVLAFAASVASAHGFGASHALIALAVLAAAQNVSHSVEPVPPIITGAGFETFPVYWAHASNAHRARLLALNALYLPLELVSAPRLFAVHILRVMQRLGWRRAWAVDLAARADVILASR